MDGYMKFYTIFSAISIAALPSAISAMDTLEVGNQPNVQQNSADTFDADVRQDALRLLERTYDSAKWAGLAIALISAGEILGGPCWKEKPIFMIPAAASQLASAGKTVLWGLSGFSKLLYYGDAAISPFSQLSAKQRLKAAGVATFGGIAALSTAYLANKVFYHA